MYPLTVGRAGTSRLEMPIVKVDVHAPIFYFPKIFKERWGYGFRPLTFKQLIKVSLKNVGCEERFKYKAGPLVLISKANGWW